MILTAHVVLGWPFCEEAYLEEVQVDQVANLEMVLVEQPWTGRPWDLQDHGLWILTAHAVLIDPAYEEAHLEVVLVDHPWAYRPREHLGHRILA